MGLVREQNGGPVGLWDCHLQRCWMSLRDGKLSVPRTAPNHLGVSVPRKYEMLNGHQRSS